MWFGNNLDKALGVSFVLTLQIWSQMDGAWAQLQWDETNQMLICNHMRVPQVRYINQFGRRAHQQLVMESTGATNLTSAQESKQPNDVDQRTIYIGNVDYSANVRDVWRHFASCGPIKRINVKALSRFAFVEFKDKSSVEIALTYSGSSIRHRPIFVTRKRTCCGPL